MERFEPANVDRTSNAGQGGAGCADFERPETWVPVRVSLSLRPVQRIAVFARRPEPGRVKTRLSPALPSELACDLHRAMVADALAVAEAAGAGERFVYWDRPAETLARDPDEPVPAGFVERVQCRGDLGARMASAFAELLVGAGDRAVVIGSDCPSLTSASIDAAFPALETHDVVLGPTRDGGYYLIGLSKPAPAMFQSIEWGSPRVLAQTLEAARGFTVEMLPALGDIDTPADLVDWIASRLAAGDTPVEAGIATATALRRVKLLP